MESRFAAQSGAGILGGVGAAMCVLILPILTRAAEVEPDPEYKNSVG